MTDIPDRILPQIELAVGFRPVAGLVLSRDGKATIDVVGDPGTVTVIMPMRAGEVEETLGDDMVGIYLDAGVPVVIACELATDAAAFSAKIMGGGSA